MRKIRHFGNALPGGDLLGITERTIDTHQ